jgi:hypothetical protein
MRWEQSLSWSRPRGVAQDWVLDEGMAQQWSGSRPCVCAGERDGPGLERIKTMCVCRRERRSGTGADQDHVCVQERETVRDWSGSRPCVCAGERRVVRRIRTMCVCRREGDVWPGTGADQDNACVQERETVRDWSGSRAPEEPKERVNKLYM